MLNLKYLRGPHESPDHRPIIARSTPDHCPLNVNHHLRNLTVHSWYIYSITRCLSAVIVRRVWYEKKFCGIYSLTRCLSIVIVRRAWYKKILSNIQKAFHSRNIITGHDKVVKNHVMCPLWKTLKMSPDMNLFITLWQQVNEWSGQGSNYSPLMLMEEITGCVKKVGGGGMSRISDKRSRAPPELQWWPPLCRSPQARSSVPNSIESLLEPSLTTNGPISYV